MNKNVHDLGWYAQGSEAVLHRWHIRPPMQTAISACGLVCKDPLNFKHTGGNRCPACENLEEMRQLGLTGLTLS